MRVAAGHNEAAARWLIPSWNLAQGDPYWYHQTPNNVIAWQQVPVQAHRPT